MQVRNRSSRRNRSQLDPSKVPTGTNGVATNSIATLHWQIDSSCQIELVGTPTDFKYNGVGALSAVQNSPSRITLTFLANCTTGGVYLIPPKSPNVRTPTGGFLSPVTGTF